MINQIAAFLNVEVSEVKKITELHYVWCVCVVGKRPVFVSKKVVTNSPEIDWDAIDISDIGDELPYREMVFAYLVSEEENGQEEIPAWLKTGDVPGWVRVSEVIKFARNYSPAWAVLIDAIVCA